MHFLCDVFLLVCVMCSPDCQSNQPTFGGLASGGGNLLGPGGGQSGPGAMGGGSGMGPMWVVNFFRDFQLCSSVMFCICDHT